MKQFSLLLLVFGCVSAYAGSSQGFVSNIIVHQPGVLMFGAGAFNNSPACNVSGQWAISVVDPMGKSFLAILLSAQAQNKQVYVHGYTQTCRDWGDRELPSYIVILD